MQSTPRILIIDDLPLRRTIIEDGLHEAGYTDVVHLEAGHRLLERIVAVEPAVIIINLENPTRDIVEQMFQVSRCVPRPVAMFVDQTDTEMTQAAVEAGVSAYVVDGLSKDRVKPVLDMCVGRFNAFARLKGELERTRSLMEERKTIDRAKAILMELRRMSEPEAYALMRRSAMNEKKRILEIAQAVIVASELLQ